MKAIIKSVYIIFNIITICGLFFTPLPLSAQRLDIRPLGNDPWLTGPESKTNSDYKLENPNKLPDCNKPVPLWVMDIGIVIPDEQGNLDMIVGGDTFYKPERAEESCRLSKTNRLFYCERVTLPPFFDAYYPFDCQVDADCIGPEGAPMDLINWKCDRDLGFCVKPDLYLFCNQVLDRALLPLVVGFCYDQRGTHPPPGENPVLHGPGVCEWLMGDHHCLTALYDDTCNTQCLADPAVPECSDDVCDIDCLRGCNDIGHCNHRNQTFHTARVEPDGETGHTIRLVNDHPEYFIPRTRSEWHDVALFGVYPGDYFRDPQGRLYLLTDTRTWLSTSIENELLRSGYGIYSFTKNKRIPFPGISNRATSFEVWKEDRRRSVAIQNLSDYILFPRGSSFSEVSVVQGLQHDPHSSTPDGKHSYLHLLGSGPPCSPSVPHCIRSNYTDQAHLSRIAFSENGEHGFAPIEIFDGLENGKSVWKVLEGDAWHQTQSLFSFAGFRTGGVIHWRGEYWHLSETPNVDDGNFTNLHLLRSPDGLTWFDGGSFPVLELEHPRRTRFVYSSKWLPPKEAGDDLGFILSHWLTYEGYFMAETKQQRFRDYNMKAYRLRPPAPRSFLVHSNRYTKIKKGTIDLPIKVYAANGNDRLEVAVQYCPCESKTTCADTCPPWEEFRPPTDTSTSWRYATEITSKQNDVAFKRNGLVPSLTIPHPKSGGKALKSIPIDLVWNWKTEIDTSDVFVVLRFGLFSDGSETIFEDMHASMRILPAFYSADTERYNHPGGWHMTQPLSLE